MFINDYLKITKATLVFCKNVVKLFVSIALLIYYMYSTLTFGTALRMQSQPFLGVWGGCLMELKSL